MNKVINIVLGPWKENEETLKYFYQHWKSLGHEGKLMFKGNVLYKLVVNNQEYISVTSYENLLGFTPDKVYLSIHWGVLDKIEKIYNRLLNLNARGIPITTVFLEDLKLY